MRDNERKRNGRKEKSTAKKAATFGCAIIFAIFWVVVIIVGIKAYSGISQYFYLEETGGINVNEREKLPEITQVLTVEKGDSISSVAEKLKELDIIDDTTAFSKKCNSENLVIQPGGYNLTNKMTFDQITALLAAPSQAMQHTIVIREGMTQNDIANMLEEEGIVTAEEFNNACSEGVYDYDFLINIPDRESRLEGYLFPDTYNIALDATAEEIVEKLLDRFDEMFTDDMKAQAQEMNCSVDEIVTIASMIEGEIKYADERSIAASVIYNRLNQGMRLQLDCTVQYALEQRTSRVTESDLEVDSPYNTYQVDGLPEGPIGNPGKSCLEAALNPADTDYLYYVVEDVETGKHYFTDSYNDFLVAKEKYQARLN